MCPRCRRIVDVKRIGDDLVLQTHDVAPMCRQVCWGSGEPPSHEGAFMAAAEVVRLTKWLRAIAHTPHLGCDRTPTTGHEVIEQVEKAEGVHVAANCGTCKAQAALSNKEAP